MSNVINLHDTFTQSQNMLVEVPLAELLQHRYFNTDESTDVFEAREVVMDFADPDMAAGAMVSRGYVNGETVTYRSSLCEPPRVAVEDDVDVQGRDRVLFEQLCYPQGNGSPTRADAFQALLRIKAQRTLGRVNRQIERLCSGVLMNNSIIGTIPTSPTDDTPVEIEVRYYNETEGNPQRFKPAYAWGNASATPYDDVCAMVNVLTQHGTMPDDLLISAEAFALLSADDKFKAVYKDYAWNGLIERENILPKEIERARFMGRVSFGGWMLNIIVYNGAYKDNSGNITPYLPKGFVCVIKSGCGRTLCGGCTLVNAQNLGEDLSASFVAKRGKYCASKFVDVRNQKVSVRCESRPLPAPYALWQWITMDAENTNSISAGEQCAVVNLDFDCEAEGATGIPDSMKNVKVGSKVSLGTPTLSGYTFDHWELNGEVLELDADSKVTIPGEGGTVWAVFASVITFNKGTNGDGGIMYQQTILYGESEKLSPIGFTGVTGKTVFKGWSLSDGGEKAYDDKGTITPEGDDTLYALFAAS